LFELQNENGLPIWFGRHIFKDVCISGECKMIRLWLFWDGAGNYLGLQIPEQEPLTKSDHTPFEPEDYDKLEDILRDTASILKDLKPEDLIIVPDTIDAYKAYEVDGYTAATQPALAEVMVKDAVYTCHTCGTLFTARFKQKYLKSWKSTSAKISFQKCSKVKNRSTFPGP
jgi:hypothetical protein